MLIDFTVENFRSVKNEQTLSMVATNLKRHPDNLFPRNAQFVAATHDTTLLNPDLLRRDQIWFVEKDGYGATELYSLVEFDEKEVREDLMFDKWYLAGRFGALPLVS